MKNIILIISLFLVSHTIEAQKIVPIEQKYQEIKNNEGKGPKKAYYKDVNKVLDKYVGEWETTYNNKIFYFKISKITKVPNMYFKDIQSDRLKVQYKITDKKTGKVVQDKFKASSKQISDGMVEYLTKDTYPLNYYADTKEQIGCGDRGLMLLSYDSKNKLKVHVIPRQVTYIVIEGKPDPCAGVSVDLPFPRSEGKAMTLTKKK